MSLKEILKPLSENRRHYILLRVAGMESGVARKLVGISRGTYNTWFQAPSFIEVHRQLPDLVQEYRLEAIQYLRHDNRLAAVFLEKKIIDKLKEEVETGHYDLIRTNMAREVYHKLITELATVPQVQSLTWEQRLYQVTQPQQLKEGEVIEGGFIETDNQQTEQSEEG